MTLIEIALKNMSRRKAKAAFILAGLMIGVATVVALISFTRAMTADINSKLEKYGANILAVPKTDTLPLTYGGLSLGGISFEMQEINQSDLAKIGAIKNAANVAAVGPMVLGGVNIGDKRVLLAGVDFEAALILKPWWKISGRTPAADEIVIGSEAARVLNVTADKRITIEGTPYRVSGVLDPTGSQDDHLIFSRIATAQTILNKEGLISMVEVAALCNACPITEMVRQISGALPGARVMAIQQVVKGRMETLHRFKKFSYGTSAVVLLVGSLVVLVTMMGSVRERTGEIGIFRAIGFRRSHIMQIIFIEAVIISALAGLLGYAAGFGGAWVFFRLFTENGTAGVPLSTALFGGSIALSIVLGLLASAYPALMAARLDPNEALHTL
jgi:putative ABC transport system permease protein